MISPDEDFILPPVDELFNTPAVPDLDALLDVALSPTTPAPDIDIPSCDIDLGDFAEDDDSTDVTVAEPDFDQLDQPADPMDLGIDEPTEQLPIELAAQDDIDFNDLGLGEFNDHCEGL